MFKRFTILILLLVSMSHITNSLLLPVVSAQTCPSGGIILRDDSGNQITLTSSVSDLHTIGWGDKSLTIDPQGNYRAFTYDDTNFTGYQRGPFEPGIGGGIGNNTSSISIEQTSCPPPVDPPPPSGETCGVVILRDDGGNQLTLIESVADLNAIGWGDKLLSIDTGNGYRAYTFDDANYSGYQRGPFEPGIGGGIGNNTSSIRIEKTSDCTPQVVSPPQPPGQTPPSNESCGAVVLREDGGNQLVLVASVPNLSDYGFNDKSLSIEVGNGYRAYTYDDPEYQGYQRGAFEPGIGGGIGNNTSSVRIEKTNNCIQNLTNPPTGSGQVPPDDVQVGGNPPPTVPPVNPPMPPMLPPEAQPTADRLWHGYSSSDQLVGNFVQVRTWGLRFRENANTSSQLYGFVTQGEFYQILEQNGDWAKIWAWRDRVGQSGWIFTGNGYASVHHFDGTTNIPQPTEKMTFNAIGAWYRALSYEHRACAVFAVPNEFSTSDIRFTWFESPSDGTWIDAGIYGVRGDLGSQFNVSSPPDTYLYAVCITTAYFATHPGSLSYGDEMAQASNWHMRIMKR